MANVKPAEKFWSGQLNAEIHYEKTVVISSSPRKNGNSEALAKEFIRGTANEIHAVPKP